MATVHETHVRAQLKTYIHDNFGSQGKAARHWGCSDTFMSRVLRGKAEPTRIMLKDIGLTKEKVTIYTYL
jgi:hypothetical protein